MHHSLPINQSQFLIQFQLTNENSPSLNLSYTVFGWQNAFQHGYSGHIKGPKKCWIFLLRRIYDWF